MYPRCPVLIRIFTKCYVSHYKSYTCFISVGVAEECSPDVREARVAPVPLPAQGAGLVGLWDGKGASDPVFRGSAANLLQLCLELRFWDNLLGVCFLSGA